MEEIERDGGHSEIEEQKQLFDFCYKKKMLQLSLLDLCRTWKIARAMGYKLGTRMTGI